MGCLKTKRLVIWLTGLPASGKTTIASRLKEMLREKGYLVELLDGDWVRKTINTDAGFTKEERERHLLRVAWIARLLARNGIITLCSFVSPYRDVRDKVKSIIEEEASYLEVYVKVSVNTAIKRDPKGLYKRALSGEIKNFTGISDVYEEPTNPSIIVDTEKETPETSTRRIIEYLEKNGFID